MPRSKRSGRFFAPVLTECDHCRKRQRTVVIDLDRPDNLERIEAHICGQCLAESMKELDRAMQYLLMLECGPYDEEDK